MKFKILATAFLMTYGSLAIAQNIHTWKNGKAGAYSYKYVTNDPTKTRFYTLKNGLTVILSQNNKEPMITYKMAIRAGSNTDPKTNTGLAHYLEHLLFKGTDQFGTMNYAKEKPLLDKIEALYETYSKTTDPVKRKAIYHEIDQTSGEASTYSIANEYDKLMQSIGSIGTNAHTAAEETVYEENIPSNAVDKFLAVQAERFRAPVFRIFHTELEAVYEEKNRGLDDDGNKMYEAMLQAVFPTHNYGQQTTIGTIEHLKNPSLVQIRKYYNQYYVPNNMALILSGDINYDQLIKKIDKAFAFMVPKPVALYTTAPEKPLLKAQKIDLYGPNAENLFIAYRGFAQHSRQSLLLSLISSILSNDKAGLLDININQKQKMLNAGAEYNQMKDYGVFILSGAPKEGQSLEEAEKLLLEQIDHLKTGRFDEGLISATVANTKLAELQAFDNNAVRANYTMTAFIQNRATEWDQTLSETDAMGKITKQEIVDFAKSFFKQNYVTVLKHLGEDKNSIKVEKPAITAVATNSNMVSAFVKKVIDAPLTPIVPKFLDYTKDLQFGKAGSAELIYAQNTENSIFSMNYRFDMGAYHNKLLPYAARYLSYLGTDKYSAEDISRAFYSLACNYQMNVGNEVSTMAISGLQENFDKAVTLMEDVLANCKADEQALDELKGSLLKSRENAKLDKESILKGMTSYAQYGAENPFNYGLSNEEIKNMKSADLIAILHSLYQYKHMITYYGPRTLAEISAELIKVHPIGKEFKAAVPMKKFVYTSTASNKVYFTDYDMVQAEIRWVRNGGIYEAANAAKVSLFNIYFGGGMGSVVFQIIRESKALAYSTFAAYATPDNKDKQNMVIAYVGTQADKTKDAILAMNELLTTLPESDKSFQLSKGNALMGLEADRVVKEGVIFKYLADKKLGFDRDSRIDEYTGLQPLTFSSIKDFYGENLSGKAYNYCIVASEKRIDLKGLEHFGEFTKLSLKQIFGY